MPDTIEKAREVLRAKYRKWFVNTVWGHIIYKNVRKARFKLPYGMKTLQEFMQWHQKRFDLTQKRDDHPLALEAYFSITLKKTLTKQEIAMITAALAEELVDEWFADIIDYMEWGYDYEVSDIQIPTEVMKRISRNGEDFEEIDIKKKDAFTRLEARLK